MDGAEQVAGAGANDVIDLRAEAGPTLPSVRDEANRITAEITALQLMIDLVAEGRRQTSGRCRCARARGGQRCGRANAARKAK
jgi:hypothetical protein